MVGLIVLSVLAVLLAGGWIWARRRQLEAESTFPYARRGRLLSPAARHFLSVLEAITGAEYSIFVKVRAVDVVRVTHRPGSARYRRAHRRAALRRFDFVLCTADALDILCVINLDERSHQQSETEGEDNFPEELCRAAGLPLLRVIARRDYDLTDMRQRVNDAMGHGRISLPSADTEVTLEAHEVIEQTAPAAWLAPPSDQTGSARNELEGHEDASTLEDPSAPTCPRCGGPMMRRHIHIGRHPGGEFWSCRQFPECRGIVPVVRDTHSQDLA
ncbi:DUF2726 domain-containing protein [Oleiagrimonas sp. C23AA]|uniref:DUF2726 domain-containing protein n=1 Tax=Oleiagrimonas sp. C23AA TaxID=2719047 RepID=UPI0014231236|nr:DUF2726 domain-containing protein [Oleiagrimonas sp. C23AA]NII09279.1 DUF2726 domain-containing protein [Oleiagrimonas sp. C23AA]